MDTTLRDGEQTHGVSIPGDEKLILAQRLLEEVGVDRIEITSCRVSKGEQKSLRRIMDWAEKHGFSNSVEVLSFVDHKKSIDWMLEAGCHRMNLLTKGSRYHCETQLRKSLTDHLKNIEQTVAYGLENGVTPLIYLEVWSNGMIEDSTYVFEMLDAISTMPFEAIHLCDTLGVLAPYQVSDYISQLVTRYPNNKFEYHGHNDYGLATANALAAAQAGAKGIHVTVNGLGERAGNASLAEVAVCLKDHSEFATNVEDKQLKEVSKIVEAFSGKRIGANTPLTGNDVFTQTAGIHADGDAKGNLYESQLTPKRFGRDRVYALGKLSGRSNLDFNLNKLHMELTDEQHKAVLAKIIELGDKKETVTTEDLPFLISDLLSTMNEKEFEVLNFVITTTTNMSPAAHLRVQYLGEVHEAIAYGNGGFDAFMKAIRQIAAKITLFIPRLEDFEVHIPPGGSSDALVECLITWEGGLKTRAVSSDQVAAAVIATERVINLIINQEKRQSSLEVSTDQIEKNYKAMNRD